MKGTDWAGRWGGCPVWRTWCPCPAWWGRCPTRPACSSHSPGGWSHLQPAIRGKGSRTIGWSDLPLVCDHLLPIRYTRFPKNVKFGRPRSQVFILNKLKGHNIFFIFCKNFPFSSRTITKRKLETKNAKIFCIPPKYSQENYKNLENLFIFLLKH